MQGILFDGTVIAVKQLSSKSKQGSREFVNEIGMISGLQHPNLVRLYGCCIAGEQLLLVYEYMENNSLAHALFNNGKLVFLYLTMHQKIYIYIYIYIQRERERERAYAGKHEILPNDTFYAKRIKIFLSATLEIGTN